MNRLEMRGYRCFICIDESNSKEVKDSMPDKKEKYALLQKAIEKPSRRAANTQTVTVLSLFFIAFVLL